MKALKHKSTISNLIVLVSLVIFLYTPAQASNKKVSLFPFGGTGFAASVNEITNNVISYDFAFQSTYRILSFFSVGGEVGYAHMYMGKGGSRLENSTIRRQFAYFHATSTFHLLEDIFFYEIGFGPYFGFGKNHKDIQFGITLSAGAEFPIIDWISIPVMFRARFLVPQTVRIGIIALAGVKFKI